MPVQKSLETYWRHHVGNTEWYPFCLFNVPSGIIKSRNHTTGFSQRPIQTRKRENNFVIVNKRVRGTYELAFINPFITEKKSCRLVARYRTRACVWWPQVMCHSHMFKAYGSFKSMDDDDRFGLVGISTFVSYLMPNPYFLNDSKS